MMLYICTYTYVPVSISKLGRFILADSQSFNVRPYSIVYKYTASCACIPYVGTCVNMYVSVSERAIEGSGIST